MTTLPPWSYSAIECFEQCPRKFYHRYILKEKGPESPQMAEGNKFDKAVESRLRDGVILPQEYSHYEPLAESFYQMRGEMQLYTQLKMGIKRDFTPSSFFGAGVWGRGALDVALVSKRSEGKPNSAIIADWKMGKNNENKQYSNDGLQLKIFTLLLFKNFPGIEKVTSFNLWLKTNEIGNPRMYTRADEPALWRELLPKIIKMEKACTDNNWIEMPGPLCAYCPVKICQHNRS